MSVTSLKKTADEVELVRDLPWNEASIYNGDWLERSQVYVIVGAIDDIVPFVEIRSEGLGYLEIKPVDEEGYTWIEAHRTHQSVVWHRHVR